MDGSTTIILAIISINFVLFTLMVVWIRFFRSSAESSARPLLGSSPNNSLEQRLVLEAISACALEPGIESIIKALGHNASEKTGYPLWMIWLKNDKGEFYLAASDSTIKKNSLLNIVEPKLTAWVRQNPEAVPVSDFLVNLCNEPELASTLKGFGDGIYIPCNDGQQLLGFILLGGKKQDSCCRSDDFLNLFGAFAAIIIKKALADEQQRLMEKERYRSDSLANLGKLAAGLAHEIRNPLTFMKAAMQRLQKKYTFEDGDSNLAAGIVEEIDRINKHVEELLSLGRIDPIAFQEVDFNEIVRKAVNLVESTALKKNIRIKTKSFDHAAIVLGNNDLLWQIVLNLLLNSIDAISQEGEIRLNLDHDKDAISLEVRDSGCGIPPDKVEQIFDPFFTTKEQGTGLGLSTAYNVAKAHEGALELVTTGPKGTAFRLRIPLQKTGEMHVQ